MSDSCNPMDCSLPGCSVHGILQARILEWVAISFSRGSSSPRNRTQVSCTAGRVFTNWATREVPERWAPKNWYFWTVVLEKTLENPLDGKEIKPVHPKEISPEYSLEGLMLKLKLKYFCHLMQRTDSLEKTLVLGKIEGRRRRRWQRMRWLDGITNSMDMNLSKLQDTVKDREAWHCSPSGWKELDKTEWLNWLKDNSIHITGDLRIKWDKSWKII